MFGRPLIKYCSGKISHFSLVSYVTEYILDVTCFIPFTTKLVYFLLVIIYYGNEMEIAGVFSLPWIFTSSFFNTFIVSFIVMI